MFHKNTSGRDRWSGIRYGTSEHVTSAHVPARPARQPLARSASRTLHLERYIAGVLIRRGGGAFRLIVRDSPGRL
jgi:hypothetical protein